MTAFVAAAVAVAVFATGAMAVSPERVSFTFSATSLGAQQSTTLPGNVLAEHGHGYAGIVQDDVACCELSLLLDREVDLDTMRGSVSGTMVIAGNAAGVRWEGELSGRLKPDGGSGKVVLRDGTGRTISGKWSQDGNPDPRTFHAITISLDGRLTG